MTRETDGRKMETVTGRNRLGSKWTYVTLLVMAVLGLAAGTGCVFSTQYSSGGPESAVTIGPRVGQQAPDFSLVDLDGNPVSLSDFRGKVVLINFWATWCPPCRQEMPAIEALHQEYKDRDVVVIGIDTYESPDKVRRFVQEGGYNWTFAIDTTGLVSRDYRIVAVPSSFFVDRNGIVRAAIIGPMTLDTMEADLAKAMR
jgi:peroxiredoxin